MSIWLLYLPLESISGKKIRREGLLFSEADLPGILYFFELFMNQFLKLLLLSPLLLIFFFLNFFSILQLQLSFSFKQLPQPLLLLFDLLRFSHLFFTFFELQDGSIFSQKWVLFAYGLRGRSFTLSRLVSNEGGVYFGFLHLYVHDLFKPGFLVTITTYIFFVKAWSRRI